MKGMNEQNLFEYLALFLSASLASVFKYFNEKQKGCFISL